MGECKMSRRARHNAVAQLTIRLKLLRSFLLAAQQTSRVQAKTGSSSRAVSTFPPAHKLCQTLQQLWIVITKRSSRRESLSAASARSPPTGLRVGQPESRIASPDRESRGSQALRTARGLTGTGLLARGRAAYCQRFSPPVEIHVVALHTPCIALLSTDTEAHWCCSCIHCNSSWDCHQSGLISARNSSLVKGRREAVQYPNR
jgi:hypothetical protein